MRRGWIIRGRVVALLSLVALPLTAAAAPEHVVSGEPVGPPYKVGYRILKIPRQTNAPLVVAVWYPTKEQATLKTYVAALPHLEGRVALGAVPARGPFPLVVFSHGGIGAGICAMSWAEALAADCFVVAAPDHHDQVTLLRSDMEHPPTRAQTLRALGWAMRLSRGKEKGPTARDEYEHRPREIRATLDALLEAAADKNSPFHGLVDPGRIGLTGVSFGSWTTWAVAGGVRIYHDPRVKAIIPMAPSAGRMDLGRIRVPQMIVFGERETILLLDKRPGAPMKAQRVLAYYEKAFPPKILVGIKGAEHLDFDPDGMMTRGLPHPAARKVRTTAEVRRNDPLTRAIVRFQTAFWRRYLRGDRKAEARLVSPGGKDVYLFKAQLGRR